tara:strand:- start:118 stop:252 length:135 start_codon:yes stop_codon:yes gene_type:complete
MNREQELKIMKLEDEYLEALTSNTLDKYPKNYFTNKKIEILLNK